MKAVSAVSILQMVCAIAIVLAVVSLALASFARGMIWAAIAFSVAIALLAVASWVVVVLRPSNDVVISAGGATAAFAASVGAIAMAIGVERGRQIERELERGRMQLRSLIDNETRQRVGELDRILARARADSSSQLAEQERGIAETRRHAIAEAEQAVYEKLAQMLTQTQHDVEDKIASWRRDLGRSEDALARQVSDLVRKSQNLIKEMRARIDADGDRIASESEEHRAAIARLHDEMAESLEQALARNQEELEKFANERRRAIQEIVERLGRREHEVLERVEREEAEMQRRIQMGVAEIERRQLEQLQRFMERAVSSVSDEHAAQFEDATRSAREEAARRLNRELERGIDLYSKQAQTKLDERMRILSEDSERRMAARLDSFLEEVRQRAELSWSTLDKRVADFELELRARLETLGSEAESARTALESRLHQLHRHLDDLRGTSSTLEQSEG
jgi:hypothetical protein